MTEDRYTRHRPLLSEEGWERLCGARILIAGVGGLGSHVLGSLGRLAPLVLELWDPGVTDEPDLNRQVLYGPQDLGRNKVETAAERLCTQNPELKITAFAEALTVERFAETRSAADAPEVDVVFDCLDSFSARAGLADIQLRYELPVFHAGVEGWYGQASSFLSAAHSYEQVFGKGFREIPPAGKPIFAHVVAVLAATQVSEFLSWCEDPGRTPLSHTLLLYDGRSSTIDKIALDNSEQ